MGKITLQRFLSEGHQLGPLPNQQAWPITIVATGIDMPSEIFVYQVGKDQDPIPGDLFTNVASPIQLHELPANVTVPVDENTQLPFYRRNTLELLARSAAEADDIWTKVQEEVSYLVRDYNLSEVLVNVDTAEVLETGNTELVENVNPPTRILLSYHPCGVAGLAGSVQTISAPFTPEKDGWLPVSEAPGTWVVPPNAVLFYNIDQDSKIKDLFPLKEPVSGHVLTRNGIVMPFGITYTIDENTIWWKEFDPDLFATYDRAAGQVEDLNFPWPQDYVDRFNPGATTPQIAISIYT